jgi:Ni,Fe-hydrogenase III small subunit
VSFGSSSDAVAGDVSDVVIPDPKWVAAVGDGIFPESQAVLGGVKEVVPVDLHIRGCPPSPTRLLEGLLALLEQR